MRMRMMRGAQELKERTGNNENTHYTYICVDVVTRPNA